MGRLGDGCLKCVPESLSRVETIPLIDVLWPEGGGDRVAAAFEVEHTTSIHSGTFDAPWRTPPVPSVRISAAADGRPLSA